MPKILKYKYNCIIEFYFESTNLIWFKMKSIEMAIITDDKGLRIVEGLASGQARPLCQI